MEIRQFKNRRQYTVSEWQQASICAVTGQVRLLSYLIYILMSYCIFKECREIMVADLNMLGLVGDLYCFSNTLSMLVDLVTLTLNFDVLFKNFTLAITFKSEELGLSYCVCAFLVTWPFTSFHNIWLSDLDLEVWPTFQKLYPWPWLSNQKCYCFHIAYMHSLWQDLSHHSIIFYLVTLTLKFDLLFKNFNLGHNLWTMRDRAFIFHMRIPCD